MTYHVPVSSSHTKDKSGFDTHIDILVGEEKKGNKKNMFDRTTLMECNLLDKKFCTKSNSLITKLITEWK